MRKHGDLYATVGKWTGNDGKVHKRKIRCGVIMRDDQSGRQSIRIELLPVMREWSGWLSVVPAGGDDETGTTFSKPCGD